MGYGRKFQLFQVKGLPMFKRFLNRVRQARKVAAEISDKVFEAESTDCKECGQPLKASMWGGGRCDNQECSEYSRD